MNPLQFYTGIDKQETKIASTSVFNIYMYLQTLFCLYIESRQIFMHDKTKFILISKYDITWHSISVLNADREPVSPRFSISTKGPGKI